MFEKNFETEEVGAAVAITLDGEPVVDLQGGTTGDPRGFRLIGALYGALAG